jgi:hypothetical protein
MFNKTLSHLALHGEEGVPRGPAVGAEDFKLDSFKHKNIHRQEYY